MADQEDFPDIYLDESVSPGGVGSEADPYSDFSEINWSSGGDNSITDYYAGTPTASVTINLKRGEEWREQLSIGANGVAAYPIVVQPYGSGADPIISAADLVTGWTLSGTSNVWKATLTVEPEQLWMDGTFGHRRDVLDELGGGSESLVDEYDWFWDVDGSYFDLSATTLYIYAATDPDSRYTAPGVEAGQRTRCGNISGRSYCTFDGIVFTKSEQHGLNVYNCDYVIAQNCTFEWAWENGIAMGGNSGGARSGGRVLDCVGRYCAVEGISSNYNTGSVMTDHQFLRNTTYENGRHQVHSAGEWQYAHTWTGGMKHWHHNAPVGAGVIIAENHSYNNGTTSSTLNSQKGNGIWLDWIDGSAANPVVCRHNVCHDNQGSGIFIEISDYMDVYGNVLYDNANSTQDTTNAPAGIKIGTRASYTSDNNRLFNNTISGGGVGIQVIASTPVACSVSNNIVKNNIAVGCSTANLRATDGGDNVTWGSGNVYENNCFGAEDTNFIKWGTSFYSTYDAFITASSQADNNVEGDPDFFDDANDKYWLATGSPCIGAGAEL